MRQRKPYITTIQSKIHRHPIIYGGDIIYKINHREKEMSGNKHLIVCQGEELEVFRYVKKLSNSNIIYNLCLMEFKHKVEDDAVLYYYSIGDRISLRELAETKGLRRRDLLSVVNAIVFALSEAKAYDLAQECFIIDSEFIYIGEVDSLITYIPFEINADPKAEFRRLVSYISANLTGGMKELNELSDIIKDDFTFEDIREYFHSAEELSPEGDGDEITGLETILGKLLMKRDYIEEVMAK